MATEFFDAQMRPVSVVAVAVSQHMDAKDAGLATTSDVGKLPSFGDLLIILGDDGNIKRACSYNELSKQELDDILLVGIYDEDQDLLLDLANRFGIPPYFEQDKLMNIIDAAYVHQ